MTESTQTFTALTVTPVLRLTTFLTSPIMDRQTVAMLTPFSTPMCSSRDTVPSSLLCATTPFDMDSLRRSCQGPPSLPHVTMPYTPKQLVAASPARLVKTSAVMLILPLPFIIFTMGV